MKTILVTGGSGLVGRALKDVSEEYTEQYKFIFLSSIQCDLTDYEQTKQLFEKSQPDYVIHLAANVGGLYKNLNFKVDMFEQNIMINLNVLKCCHLYNVKKVVSCLSTCIFPDNTQYPINEKMLHNGPPHYSNDAYAYAKRMLEVQSRAYNEQYNRNFVCVIPTNIYGPYDNYHLEDSHVIPALIHKCYIAKNNNDKFIIKGSGKALRQFIFSYDLAKLLLWTIEQYHSKEPIILSTNQNDEISIKDVAIQIAKNFNYEDMIEFDTKFPDGQYKKTADNTKLRQLYPDVKFTPLEIGLSQTIKWFMDNYDTVRK